MTDIAPLTRAETIALDDCEQRIERGLKTFFEVGAALSAIRDNRLYRASHGTFELYCLERWNMTPQHANRLALAAGVVASMEPNGSIPLPSTESQARELAKLPEADRADVWAEAVERTGGKPTAKAVSDVAKERSGAVPDEVRQAVEDVTDEPEPLTLDRELVLATLPRSEAEAVGIGMLAEWLGMHPERPLRPLRELLQSMLDAGDVGRVQGETTLVWWAVASAPAPEDHPDTGEGRSAGLTSALSRAADESAGSAVDPGAADKLPAGPDPDVAAAMVAAALDQFVPDPNAGTFAWRKDLHARLKPAHQVTLWVDVDDAAEFASADDVETIRQLALSFADLHRRILAARNGNVVQLRAVQ